MCHPPEAFRPQVLKNLSRCSYGLFLQPHCSILHYSDYYWISGQGLLKKEIFQPWGGEKLLRNHETRPKHHLPSLVSSQTLSVLYLCLILQTAQPPPWTRPILLSGLRHSCFTITKLLSISTFKLFLENIRVKNWIKFKRRHTKRFLLGYFEYTNKNG